MENISTDKTSKVLFFSIKMEQSTQSHGQKYSTPLFEFEFENFVDDAFNGSFETVLCEINVSIEIRSFAIRNVESRHV